MPNNTSNPRRPAVVLVADRTLSARYKVLFEGIFATMQTSKAPQIAMKYLLSPKMYVDGAGRALAAPLGIRRVQSSILDQTDLGPDDVVCTTPEALGGLLGPWTKVVGVSSSDPLGQGMSNTTTTAFWSGELYTARWTRKMMHQIKIAKEKYDFTVIAGGAGAWQWARSEEAIESQGIDVVFEGYFEQLGPQMISNIIAGRSVQTHIVAQGTSADKVRPIAGASVLGIVELSRGCGNGCGFCTMGKVKMDHLPHETILADLQTNVSAGFTSVVSGSEDFFRYGAASGKVNFEALRGLLEEMRLIDGLGFMQIDHGNISSVLQYEDDQLREIRRLLTWSQPSKFLWVNMGVESANGHLVAANGSGKMAPFDPADWGDMVRQAADKMVRTGFYPVFSVVLGLPGETPSDVSATLQLVKDLVAKNVVIFPIFYEPQTASNEAFSVSAMTADHLKLYTVCYENNFKRVPDLFWDNQRAGGVSWFKRALLQMLGKTEVSAWRKNFRTIAKQIAARTGEARK
jgi:hypothetical protein